MRKGRKWLAMICVSALLVGLVPTAAFAAEEDAAVPPCEAADTVAVDTSSMTQAQSSLHIRMTRGGS